VHCGCRINDLSQPTPFDWVINNLTYGPGGLQPIPIPPAAWLFTSALAILEWGRRPSLSCFVNYVDNQTRGD
jgi:hypothetical protein